MDLTDITKLHTAFVRPGFGTTTPEELEFIQSVIHKYKPKKVIEIGTASGLTTGFIARFLEDVGGDSVTSVDISDRFFGDPGQKVGYLATKIYGGDKVEIQIETGKSSLDLTMLEGPWDLAFIDASHNHPWPTIDTLAVAAHLTGPRIVIHHDLQLFRRFKPFLGIGPRVLFNETPEKYRHASPANGWNIFYIDLKMDPVIFEEMSLNALSMPWTSRPPMTKQARAQVQKMLAQSYSPAFLDEFNDCEKQNRWTKVGKLIFHAKNKVAKIRKMLRGGPQV